MIRMTVTRNNFDKIAASLPARGRELVATTALEVHDGAKQRSRIDTGTMMRGWHVEFQGPFHAIIGNPVDYAPYNEYGTAHMAAQPMVIPSVEQARARFNAGARALFKP